ncbi:hypothetical protein EsH8_XIII_000025 [Colletotrichum jinshuiense]
MCVNPNQTRNSASPKKAEPGVSLDVPDKDRAENALHPSNGLDDDDDENKSNIANHNLPYEEDGLHFSHGADEGDSACDDLEPADINSEFEKQREVIGSPGHSRHQHYQDDQRAIQKIKSRPQRIGDNHAAENGIIESVECIKFMGHERRYVELCPLINFIVGKNGSGKSAVLAALTLCLGGKASLTPRRDKFHQGR